MVKKSIPLMNEQIPLLPELIFRIHYYYPTICETEVRLNTKKNWENI